MCSYDVVSLFTNIPLDETINISLEKLYQSSAPPAIPKAELRKLLEFATKESHFLFNGNFYDQNDGIAMGSPLGPIMANIFMTDFERKWITNLANSIAAPICWRRYVDDTFTLFNSTNDAVSFLNYLNDKHPNIKFTHELEHDEKLSFLDILIININGTFQTTIFRKKTFTGLYTKWDSFLPRKYKVNLINTLIDRFWNICSDKDLFDREVSYLKELLMKNGYPSGIINYNVRNYIEKRNGLRTDVKEGPEKLSLLLILPYLGFQSEKFRKKLNGLVSKFYGGIIVKVVFRNRNNIGSHFKCKDRIDKLSKSNVVYQYLCDICGDSYIGKTIRTLKERKPEHFKALTKDYLHSSTRFFFYKKPLYKKLSRKTSKNLQNLRNFLN